ncbi:MAG TPA: pitrilysin family protein [Vicinamibacterales bacterium]|jgi:zinc protease|nr:pitrilysin family protein [Vicinamibacterales bacterium]
MTRASQMTGLAPVRHILANGVVSIVQETSFSPAVTISAAVRAGSVTEPPSQPGLAAFLGRVLDRGTKHLSTDVIAEALDDRGVVLRVSTNRHTQTISCTCLAEDFADMLSLVAAIVREPAFPAEEIEKRRAETITAIRQDLDNPGVRASEALQSLLYGADHPYGRPAKGSIESVERFTREDLLAMYIGSFAPALTTVAIVGDVDAAAAIDQVSQAFGAWQHAARAETLLPPPPAARERREIRIDMPDKSQCDIAYGFVTIDRFDPAYYAYWAMNNVLGQFGLGGRLAENIRERQGMAYYAFSAFDPSLGPGPLVIRAGVDPRNVERAIESIDAEVSALGKDGPTEREMSETRQYLIGSIPRLLETNHSIAAFLLSAEFFGLGLDYDRRLPEYLERVTIEQVHDAAAAVLHPERAALAVAGPNAGATA